MHAQPLYDVTFTMKGSNDAPYTEADARVVRARLDAQAIPARVALREGDMDVTMTLTMEQVDERQTDEAHTVSLRFDLPRRADASIPSRAWGTPNEEAAE